jgi:acyl-[acyl-carrier-protein]-phospholipid O-acyltransferase / long-chain-fatty-acid--[acyl-carrier-protein] ligase
LLLRRDRVARFSKIAGEMVPHGKVKDALNEVLGSGRCVVTGVPDERRGERLAVIYTGESMTPAEMIQALEDRGLPPLWIPKRDRFRQLEGTPTLGTGKVDLAAVRRMRRSMRRCCSDTNLAAPGKVTFG